MKMSIKPAVIRQANDYGDFFPFFLPRQLNRTYRLSNLRYFVSCIKSNNFLVIFRQFFEP